MPGVEQDGVVGGPEDTVQGQRELDDPQVRPQVAAVPGDRGHDELADLGGQLLQLLEAEGSKVGGSPDGLEEGCIGKCH